MSINMLALFYGKFGKRAIELLNRHFLLIEFFLLFQISFTVPII